MGVPWFSTVSHGHVRTKSFELVLVGFHVDNTSTSGHVGGEDDIVFA